jgi:hypothetical protein
MCYAEDLRKVLRATQRFDVRDMVCLKLSGVSRVKSFERRDVV